MKQTYEIKINRKWIRVTASSMKALSDYCKSINANDWRMLGMQSRAETLENKSLLFVG